MATERNYVPGDVVETAYGVGVITHCPDDDTVNTFRVMLWRTPGKSIASCSVAFLQANVVSTKEKEKQPKQSKFLPCLIGFSLFYSPLFEYFFFMLRF
jgi:hypothetical protein